MSNQSVNDDRAAQIDVDAPNVIATRYSFCPRRFLMKANDEALNRRLATTLMEGEGAHDASDVGNGGSRFYRRQT